MAFSNVQADLVIIPKAAFSGVGRLSVLIANLSTTYVAKYRTGYSLGSPEFAEDISKQTHPIAVGYSAACRDSILGTMQSNFMSCQKYINDSNFVSRFFMKINQEFTRAQVDYALNIAGYPATMSVAQSNDSFVFHERDHSFSMPAKNFDWAKLGVVQMMLRSTDWLSVDAWSNEKALVHEIIQNHAKAFPNNSNTGHMGIILAWGIWNRKTDSTGLAKSNAAPFGYRGLGFIMKGTNAAVLPTIYQNLSSFLDFVKIFNITANDLTPIACPMKCGWAPLMKLHGITGDVDEWGEPVSS